MFPLAVAVVVAVAAVEGSFDFRSSLEMENLRSCFVRSYAAGLYEGSASLALLVSSAKLSRVWLDEVFEERLRRAGAEVWRAILLVRCRCCCCCCTWVGRVWLVSLEEMREAADMRGALILSS